MISLKKAMATHSSTLAWKIPWMEEPGRLQFMGSRRVGHDWTTSLSCIGAGNGNPLRCSCLENPRDRGAGGLPSMGSHRVGHNWCDLAAAASLLAIHGLHSVYVITLEARTAMHLGPLQFWASDFLIRSSVFCVAQACGVHHLHHLTVSLCLTVLNLLFHVVHIFFLALLSSFNGVYFLAVFWKRAYGG